ncbi:MAG: ABC transporter permease [Acidobacteriia bacterium]|nr:ABC transporter permease [Terriglobia bacterium]
MSMLRNLLRNLKTGLRSLFRKDAINSEIDEELQGFLAAAVEDNLRQGMSPEEAERAARVAMGSAAAVKDQVHAAGWEAHIETLVQDVRYGLRALRNQPGFTAVAVLTLALGIGVNTGIFTILNAATLKPLTSPHAGRLISIYQQYSGKVRRNIHGSPGLASIFEYQQYRDSNHVLDGLAAYAPFVQVTLGGKSPKQVMGTLISCDYFDVLEVRMAMGRRLNAADCAGAGASPAVVLSHDLWRTEFAGDPRMIGSTIHLNREPFVVVGVAAPGFYGTEASPSAWWAPVTMQKALIRDEDLLSQDNTSWLVLRGRMKPGVSLQQTRADLGVIASRLDLLHPGRITRLNIHQASMFDLPEMRGIILGVGAVILCAVGMVLLVACANVANLLLARAVSRRKEIAVRLAIGATRGRIVRQLLTESLLLAILGGTLGTLVSFWSSAALVRFLLAHLPPGSWTFIVDVTPDLRVIGGALALTLLTGLVFGLAPALQASRPSLTLAMKEESSEPERKSSRLGFLRSALVSTQVAVSVVLLLATGLFLRGLYHAQISETGFEMRNIATVSFDLTGAGYDDQRAQSFQQLLHDRVAALPGVDRVAAVAVIPLSSNFESRGFRVKSSGADYQIEVNRVQPSYFSLVQIPIVRGRNFADAEVSTGAPVVIVTEATARRLWPGEDPLGKVLTEDKSDFQVIGVAHDAQVSHRGDVSHPYMYLPAGPKDQIHLSLMAHTSAGFGATQREIRSVAAALDPELPVDVVKLEDNMEFWRTGSRVVSMLSGFLGALALVLAAIGVYGMVSYGVSRRVREIGIRMALGADRGNVVWMIVRNAMLPVTIGEVIGIAGCAAVSTILSSLLYGVSPHDPLAFFAVPAFLLIVALLACYLPARRAMRVNPMEALRCG